MKKIELGTFTYVYEVLFKSFINFIRKIPSFHYLWIRLLANYLLVTHKKCFSLRLTGMSQTKFSEHILFRFPEILLRNFVCVQKNMWNISFYFSFKIPFPGICQDAFKALQEYLYTGETPCMTGLNCMNLIEVANRLCLPRLVALAEEFVVQELSKMDEANADIMEEVFCILETAQVSCIVLVSLQLFFFFIQL